MILEILPKFQQPIVVLSSFRTGGTALCDYISQTFEYHNFDEVLHDAVPHRTASFVEYLNYHTHVKYVVKIIPSQINDNNQELANKILAESYIIKLTRKNIYEQILSLYTAETTAQWHYKNTDQIQQYEIPVNIELLKYSMDFIKTNNQLLENFECTPNLKLAYEDIGVLKSKYIPYHRPANWQDVITALDNINKDHA